MKNILLLGTGKSSTVLTKKLYEMSTESQVAVTVSDLRIDHLSYAEHKYFKKLALDINDFEKLKDLIIEQDIVVSLMPASFHSYVAKICLEHGKHFLTASYLDPEIKAMDKAIAQKGLFFVNEMGLDPGIDHLLAAEMIEEIRNEGGRIISFESYCGGLIAPSSDDNPLHYKITWNPMNIVNAGKAGAQYLEHGAVVRLDHEKVFRLHKKVDIPAAGNFEMYPNRDSLPYIDLYGIQETDTFIRGTLRLPGFCEAWLTLIELGLTSENITLSNEALHKIKTEVTHPAVQWLLKDTFIPISAKQATEFLLDTIDQKLMFKDTDQDRVVLYHKILYTKRGQTLVKEYLLDRMGQNKKYTAMSETVGMPLLVCVQLILENKFSKPGILMPTDSQVHTHILSRLRSLQVIP
ncbi:MAG TPA: saccharopine dehydrogenase C-terminal domain-containing protein [Cytophagales bacterium]|nr:saccharopine dehydrogenase C-terminal domain-containing protein [Cytophagales bacterium]